MLSAILANPILAGALATLCGVAINLALWGLGRAFPRLEPVLAEVRRLLPVDIAGAIEARLRARAGAPPTVAAPMAEMPTKREGGAVRSIALLVALAVGAAGAVALLSPVGCASQVSALQVERDAVALAATGLRAIDAADLEAYKAALAAAPSPAAMMSVTAAEGIRARALKDLSALLMATGAALESPRITPAGRLGVLRALADALDDALAEVELPTGPMPGVVIPPAARAAVAALRAVLAELAASVPDAAAADAGGAL